MATLNIAQALDAIGSNVIFHREDGGDACPCRTEEGFRDPAWHHVHDTEPECNEQGFLNATTQHFTVKASVQGALTRYYRSAQRPNERDLGWIEADDKLAVFPAKWEGHTLDFRRWSDGGEDYIIYDGERYTCVVADKWPNANGDPDGHWEVGLRLMKTERPTDA